MRSFRLLAVSVLAAALVISSALSVEANGPTFNLLLTPSCGPPGTLVTFTYPGSPTSIDEKPSLFTTTINCPVNQPCFFTVLNVPVGQYKLFWYMPDGSTGIGSFFVGDCPAVGGVVMPANTFALLSPWLAVIAVTGFIAAIVVMARKRFDS
jgi:hypothetical protein